MKSEFIFSEQLNPYYSRKN